MKTNRNVFITSCFRSSVNDWEPRKSNNDVYQAKLVISVYMFTKKHIGVSAETFSQIRSLFSLPNFLIGEKIPLSKKQHLPKKVNLFKTYKSVTLNLD